MSIFRGGSAFRQLTGKPNPFYKPDDSQGRMKLRDVQKETKDMLDKYLQIKKPPQNN